MIQKDINNRLGIRTSSEEEVDRLERNAGVPDMQDESDTLQRSSCLEKQPMVQSRTANEEPIPVLARKKLYILNKNHEPD